MRIMKVPLLLSYGSAVATDTAIIFTKGDIQHPVQLVLNPPVCPFSHQNRFSIIGCTADEVASLVSPIDRLVMGVGDLGEAILLSQVEEENDVFIQFALILLDGQQ